MKSYSFASCLATSSPPSISTAHLSEYTAAWHIPQVLYINKANVITLQRVLISTKRNSYHHVTVGENIQFNGNVTVLTAAARCISSMVESTCVSFLHLTHTKLWFCQTNLFYRTWLTDHLLLIIFFGRSHLIKLYFLVPQLTMYCCEHCLPVTEICVTEDGSAENTTSGRTCASVCFVLVVCSHAPVRCERKK